VTLLTILHGGPFDAEARSAPAFQVVVPVTGKSPPGRRVSESFPTNTGECPQLRLKLRLPRELPAERRRPVKRWKPVVVALAGTLAWSCSTNHAKESASGGDHESSATTSSGVLRPVGHDEIAAMPPNHPGAPCSLSERGTLTSVWRKQPHVRPMVATDPLANNHNLRSVWICGGSDPAFVYTTGVVVYLEAANVSDPRQWAEGIAADDHAKVRTIRGIPGVVNEPRPSGDGSQGGVEVIDHGVWIGVDGNHHLSGARLIAIANSIKPYR
jgi:hypothetical protein